MSGSPPGRALAWPVNRCRGIWETLRKDRHYWRRMVKIVIASSIANGLMLIPSVQTRIGQAAYLSGITTGFGHPGRRFGQMAEALILVALGTLLATAWTTLGVYLSSLVTISNPSAAVTIRGLFLAVSLLLHGYVRSFTPRLFLGTVLFILVSVINLVSTSKRVTLLQVTNILYPIGISIGLLLLVNLLVFPEFSSDYLGSTVTSSLHEVAKALKQAGDYFTLITVQNIPEEASNDASITGKDGEITVRDIITSKTKIRAKLALCKATQNECNFELAYSTLPPRKLKAISQVSMAKITLSTIAIIGACESKFALLGEPSQDAGEPDASTLQEEQLTKQLSDGVSSQDFLDGDPEKELELIKPRREIESGDPELLRFFIGQVTGPYRALQSNIDRSVDVINACIGFSYVRPPQE